MSSNHLPNLLSYLAAAGPKGKGKVQQSIMAFTKKAAAQEAALAPAEAVHKENQPSGGSNTSGDAAAPSCGGSGGQQEPEVVIME
jgi:hypothetical protein